MADGRIYTSKSALRRSYKASGNPQGVAYTEVGNEYRKPYEPPQRRPDTEGVRDAVDKAEARYRRGERPRD